ncbi:MAG: hypothetical protein IPJ84_00290 [Bdellovibrionales bacterium]|jgi:hypothetical protein|nr:hypothetical protein [Bdellovibrionales bacterium]
MKKYSLSLFTPLTLFTMSLLTVSCASLMPSENELSSAPTCKVWKDQAIKSLKNVVDVEGEEAVFKHSCSLTGCSKIYAKFKDSKTDIYTSNSGLLTLEMRAAIFDGKRFTVDSSIVKADPIEIKDGKIDYAYEALGPKQTATVSYNKACSPKQAALGFAILFAK